MLESIEETPLDFTIALMQTYYGKHSANFGKSITELSALDMCQIWNENSNTVCAMVI